MENEVRAVVAYEATAKADKNMAWDGNTAEHEMRNWASKDGSGEKTQMDWAKYRRGFAYYDAKNPEDFGSYKLPHHRVIDGQLVVVWHGCASAMAVCNGAMGGVDVPEDERPGIYNHLAKHYAQFEEQPPELKKAADSFFSDMFGNRRRYQDNRK